MDATIRKLENNLITLGTGTMIFGIWTFMKIVLTYFIIGMDFDETLTETSKIIISVIFWMIISFGLLIRAFIGLSARAQGKGKKKRLLYVIAAGVVFTFNLALIAMEFYAIIFEAGKLELIISIIIDISSQVLLMDLFVSSIRLRVLKRQIAKENGGKV